MNRIAAHLRVHSSMVSQILSGLKEISLEQAQELAGYLGFNGAELEYFLVLVQKERAGSKKLRDFFQRKVSELQAAAQEVASRVRNEKALSELEKSIFYSSPVYMSIWLFSSLGDGKTLEEISERFSLSRVRARAMLDFLVGSEICVLVEGRYRSGPQHIHLERTSPYVARHHSAWRLLAAQSPAEKLACLCLDLTWIN